MTMNDPETFALAFEQRLRATLVSAARVAGPEAALLACLNSGINFALAGGLPAEEVAALLNRMADDIEAHARDLGASPQAKH